MDVNNLPKWIFLAGWGWGGGVESVASYSTHLNRFKQVGGEYKLQKYLLGKQQKQEPESHQDPKLLSPRQSCGSPIPAFLGIFTSVLLSLLFHVHVAPEFT